MVGLLLSVLLAPLAAVAVASPATAARPALLPRTSSPAPAPSSSDPADAPDTAITEGDESATPLRVVIDRLRPSTLPDPDEELVVTGRVTNTDDSTWSDLAVYVLTSAQPMTTREELSEAVSSDPALEIGDRLIDPGLFQKAPDLEPGESTRFRLEVPGRRLMVSREPGVYWLAVHVLGTGREGRIEGADGRARTFLPHIPDVDAGTRLALGAQIRRKVVRTADGRLRFEQLWAKQLGSGRLDRVLRLSAAARVEPTRAAGARPPGRPTDAGWPLTWLVDGAVVSAAQSLAGGNPRIDLVAEGGAEVTGPGDDPTEDEAAAAAAADDPVAQRAAEWLDRFTRAARGATVLALPYGDLDVSAAATNGEDDLPTLALDEGRAALQAVDVPAAPVVAPPDGYLAPEAAQAFDPDVRILLAREALGEDGPGPTGVLAAPRGGSLTTTPTPQDLFGPTPAPTNAALAVRQRLLADAALHALSADRDTPLVALLPPTWEPGKSWRRARFFDGLDVPWLSGISLATLLDPAAVGSATTRGDDLVYPEEVAATEVPAYAVAATSLLLERSLTLQELITGDSTAASRLSRQALLTSSYWSRPFPGVATERARDAAMRVDDWLGRVSIRGPEFVTMSSERGSIQVTLVNGLDQPVTVGLAADAGGAPLTLTTPDPVELPPGGRRAMDIEADVLDIGVHQVTLQPVSESGRPLGQAATLSVRSSKVGLILWFIMAGGAVTLFGAITVRTVRRVRSARRRRRAAV